ncbi:MAG: hypothetical protein KAS12_06975, partial [Candidatus Aenigmarchaeota archaeon]|nr:hypothetical protein [Candidatus Aenigmarchaeota archaeon]
IRIPQEMDFVPLAPKPEEYARLLWRSKQNLAGWQNKTQSKEQLIPKKEKEDNLSVEKDKPDLSMIKPKLADVNAKVLTDKQPVDVSVSVKDTDKDAEGEKKSPVEKLVIKKEVKQPPFVSADAILKSQRKMTDANVSMSSIPNLSEPGPRSKKLDLGTTDGEEIRPIVTSPTPMNPVVNQIKRPTINLDHKINDIDQPVRVSDPINELSELTLTDFRRWTNQLDNQASKSAKRIKQKIDLLGEESLTKKIAGIQAWQQSAIYQLYLNLGQMSLEQNKPLIEIIKQQSLQNKPTLNLDEFNALVKLNHQLGF